MKFGYVWEGSGSADKARQKTALLAYGCDKGKMEVERSPARDARDGILSILREGDEFCAFSAQHIADDIVELHWILASVAGRGAYVYLVDFGQRFQGSEEMARLTEDYIGERRKEQTKAARERLKKLPKSARGGRPPRKLKPEEEPTFIAMWENRFKSKGDMARRFKCHKGKLDKWAAELGLGAKATP